MGTRTRRRRRTARRAAPPRPGVPATVWATGQRDPITDMIERGYHIDTADDSMWIPPAVAEYAIHAYSPPGGTVLDPDCGAGSVVVEALRAGRHAIGLATTRPWRNLARANINAIRACGAATDAMVLVLTRRSHTLRTAQTAGLAGQIDLALTALRPPADTNDGAVTTLRSLLTTVRPLLRPGGHLVVTLDPGAWRSESDSHIGQVIAVGTAAGVMPIERCVALTGRLTGDKVLDRATRDERRTARRRAREIGHPIAVSAHLDVIVFQEIAAASAELPAEHPPHTLTAAHRPTQADLTELCAA